MGAHDFNTGFVVWRECVEAFLIIGILNAWIGVRPEADRRRGRAWLWSGVGAGLVGAIALAILLIRIGEDLGEDAQVYFQTAIVLLAAGLIVQMVFWMRRNGRAIRRDLHSRLDGAADDSRWGTVFLLAALAVLREGGEAAIFLYGTMAGAGSSPLRALLPAGLGFALAAATYGALQVGARAFSWRTFFRLTEVMLLLLAGALLLTGVDNLIALGVVPQLSSRMWDSSQIVSDSGPVGGLVSSLTGYRAKPVLVQLLVFIGYWILVTWLFKHPNLRRA